MHEPNKLPKVGLPVTWIDPQSDPSSTSLISDMMSMFGNQLVVYEVAVKPVPMVRLEVNGKPLQPTGHTGWFSWNMLRTIES
jgi:hypothetical protein